MNLWKKLKTGLQTLYETIKVKDGEIDERFKKKTKKELEKLGRKIGIELDRRLTKHKLINKKI